MDTIQWIIVLSILATVLLQTTFARKRPKGKKSKKSPPTSSGENPTPPRSQASTVVTTSTQTSIPNDWGSEGTSEQITTMATTMATTTVPTSEAAATMSTTVTSTTSITTMTTPVSSANKRSSNAASANGPNLNSVTNLNVQLRDDNKIPARTKPISNNEITGSASSTMGMDSVIDRSSSTIDQSVKIAQGHHAGEDDSVVTAVSASVPTVLILVGVAMLVFILVIRRRRQKEPKSLATITSCPSIHVAIQRAQNGGPANNYSEPDLPGIDNGNNTNKDTGYTGYTEIGEITNVGDNVEYNTASLRTFAMKSDPMYNHVGHTANHYGGPKMTQDDNDGSYGTCGEKTTTQMDGAYSHANLRDARAKAKGAEPNYDHINMMGGSAVTSDDNTYSHVSGNTRGNTVTDDFDNYSNAGQVKKSADGAVSDGNNVYATGTDFQTEDGPSLKDDANSQTNTHAYFVLQKEF